ncbi:MAG: adenylyl cyclase, partial [Pseudomonadota bacterium]
MRTLETGQVARLLQNAMLGIVRELKRRNVTRVAGAYAVVGWLVAQVAVTLEESLELPGWFDATVVLLLLIGFPVALVLSWAFDLTPEGVKRTPDAVSEAELPRAGAADVAVVVALVAVVGLVGYQLLSFIRGDQPSENAPIETASIAVLPFSDMSDTGDQEYFSEGLSEEILNVLAKVDGMKVASRTSSFSFKGSDADVTKIGELLGVQHVLEGSVRKADKRLRITAQLIRAEDGFHVWSETYEKELDDVFAIQDDIANQILAELRGRIMGDAPTVAVSRAEVTAYDLVLRAQKVSETYSLPGLEAGAELYRQAIDIDPSYARAYAGLAAVELLNSNATGALGERPVADVIPVARDLLNRALELAPDDAAVWSRVGLLRQFAGDVAGAEEAYVKARELQPNVNMNNYAIMLGQQDRAIDAAALLAQQKE